MRANRRGCEQQSRPGEDCLLKEGHFFFRAAFADGSKRARCRASSSTAALSPGYQYSRWQASQALSTSALAPNNALASFRSAICMISFAAFRSASILASQRTGSLSTLALICAGDNSGGFGPVLLFTSPSGAKGLGTFRR